MGERGSRNPLLPGGVSRYSRSKMFARRASYKKRKTVPAPEKKPESRFVSKPMRGSKNGTTRNIPVRSTPKMYPTEDVRPKLKNRKANKPTRLRKSIQPGTVLILLANAHRGKRVVFLKQLKSGLLLVTGPYRVNGCPLRRVDQTYVIATQTRVDISKVNIPERVDDAYFRRQTKARKSKAEGEMFEETQTTYKASEERKADQKAVDAAILESVKKTPELLYYLRAKFTLHKGQYPHEMVF
ncbi:large ribosomal subunit protein eL6-like [Sycon ciliatum]|uniref:large ribosomal subunit protein eL6-like n=1 Tax=Sycon ciliatum TaxID=27933 RepID=UPI0031F61D76